MSAARAILVIVGLAPWLFPLLGERAREGAIGAAIDFLFASTCHRAPARTLAILGVPMPLCSRCAGLFAGFALGAIVLRPAVTPKAGRWLVAAASVPMLVDVVTQDLGLHPIWHPVRVATGLVFGYAAAVVALCMFGWKEKPAAQA